MKYYPYFSTVRLRVNNKDMKKQNPNIEVGFQGVTYKVRKTALREYTWGDNKGNKYLSIGPTEAGQMTKQFVKNSTRTTFVRSKLVGLVEGTHLMFM